MRRTPRFRGVFVTGTDTGVGKTLVACALAAWCRRQGMNVGVMKPVATGGRRCVEDGKSRWVSEDALHLARAACVRDSWQLINPICFQEPLAPWTAALRARTPIRVEAIVRAFRALGQRHDALIVEGLGGLLVPLTARLTVADLVKQCSLPVILVARAGLGTLNHTLLSLQCLEVNNLRVAGVVVNTSAPPRRDVMSRVVARTNADILRRVARVPVYGPLPFLRWHDHHTRGKQHLGEWIERCVGRTFLDGLFRDR